MNDLLLEVRIEEIPAGMQENAEKELTKHFNKFLQTIGVENVTVQVSSTPSRLILCAGNLPNKTNDIVQEKRGPKVATGLDENGNPTRALTGFMSSVGASDASDLEKRKTDKGEFFYYKQVISGQNMMNLLEENMAKIITSIAWKKSMHWGSGTLNFVRPIENICCVFAGKTVNFEIDGLKSTNTTRGHKFLAPENFKVLSSPQYAKEMLERKVLIERCVRRYHIENELKKVVETTGASLVINEKLIEEVIGLVEYPFAVVGKFDAEFLSLPREVLEITMSSHQRYFAMEKDGKLTNKFIGVSNIPDVKGYISKGYATVITARFNDAKFYWDLDRKHKLETHIEGLKRVVYQEKLGTYYDKLERMDGLLETLNPYIKGINEQDAERAIWLAKCDLITGVIGEFSELQGLMGSYYAAHDGEKASVIKAIANQYENHHFSSLLPETLALILADRLDTLVGFFGNNMEPTGSKDPFALRRAALSLIRLTIQTSMRLPLRKILGNAYKLHSNLARTEQETVNALLAFFMNRLSVILKEGNVNHDMVDAIFALGLDDVVDVARRAKALQSFLTGTDGSALHVAFKRASNILAKVSKVNGVSKSLLNENAEKQLFTSVNDVSCALNHAIEREDYTSAMGELVALRTPIDRFFDEVMVMTEDENLKANRLALLNEMTGLFTRVADFKRLAG